VHHCLEKNPDVRLQSAHDLAFDLEVALTSIVEAPAAAPQSAWRALSRAAVRTRLATLLNLI